MVRDLDHDIHLLKSSESGYDDILLYLMCQNKVADLTAYLIDDQLLSYVRIYYVLLLEIRNKPFQAVLNFVNAGNDVYLLYSIYNY